MTSFLLSKIELLQDDTEDELFQIASSPAWNDEIRLAAALLLCTCDSNERKAVQ